MVADGRQGQHQGNQTLLAIDEQPPVNPCSLQRRARGNDYRTYEVRAGSLPGGHHLALREKSRHSCASCLVPQL